MTDGRDNGPGRDDGFEEILSVGDLLTQRQRKRFKTGDMLLGRYRILGELGQGGMGLVFRCLDEVGGIEVAVKMLPPEVSHDSGEMEDVRDNFRLVSSLVHQNICAIRTLERDSATSEYFLVMELAQGMNLRTWRKGRALSPKAPGSAVGAPAGSAGSAGPSGASYNGIPLEQILPIVRQIASALDYAHDNRVVHRDVKPSNVMVDASGRVKVLDFGLAAQIHTSFSRVSHARYGTSGTGPYMAPEQWRGQFQDGSTDQYALAVLAYELLTGHCPFESHEATVLRESVLKEEPVRPAGIPPSAWMALKRGLAKGREERFATCSDFVAALGGDKDKLRKTRITRKGGLPSREHGWKWVVGGAILAVLVVAGIRMGCKPPLPAEPAPPPAANPERTPDEGVGSPKTVPEVPSEPEPPTNSVPETVDEQEPPVVVAITNEPPTPPSPPPKPPEAKKPAPKTGRLDLSTVPPGATILRDGKKYPNPTPTNNMILQPGAYELTLKLAGYLESNVSVNIIAGQTTQTNVLLEREPGSLRTFEIAPGVEMDFRWIPATTSRAWKQLSGEKPYFTMGSATDEAGRDENEPTNLRQPIARGFWLGTYEVTQGQWKKVMGDLPKELISQDDQCPVAYVSWERCQEYIGKLTSNSLYRLPTEAEWEYACRAGTKEPFAGNIAEMAWYDRNSEDRIRPAGTQTTNAWGLHDMHGNVWEWCDEATLRGGSFNSDALDCRSACRHKPQDGKEAINGNYGFRLVRGEGGVARGRPPDGE